MGPKNIFVSLILALLLGIMFSASQFQNALAQCQDATGASIPCPGGGNDNKKRPTETPIPTATSTPLPITFPQDDFLGSCNSSTGNLQECLDQFKCEDGTLVIKVDIYTGGKGSQYDVYCIPHESFPKLNLPLKAAPGSSEVPPDWVGSCSSSVDVNHCVDDFKTLCSSLGGEPELEYGKDAIGDTASVICTGIPSPSGGTGDSTAPTVIPPVSDAPQSPPQPGPADPGNGFPPGGWWPWILGVIVILIGMLLPAVQKLRDTPTARHDSKHKNEIIIESLSPDNNRSGNNKNPDLMKSNDEPGEASASGALKTVAAAQTDYNRDPQSGENPQDLLNKDKDPQAASDYLLEIDGIKGESSSHKKATLFVRKSGKDQQE